VIGTREDRELTSPEATQAFFLPFVWVLSVDQASPLYFKGVAAEEHYKSVNIPQKKCAGCKSQ
jgi:hypothetical protein